MKMRIIKMFLLPMAVFMLASAAAVGTDQSQQSKTALAMDVYLHNPTQFDCKEEKDVECEPGDGADCTVGGWQAFGLSGIGCNEVLQRI